MGAPSPVDGLLLSSLMQKIAGAGGGSSGAPGAPGDAASTSIPGAGMAGQPGGGSPGGVSGMSVSSPAADQGDALSKELSVMRIADPEMVTSKITEIKQQVMTLINHTGMSLPAVARSLSKMLQGLDGAIKAANEAATAHQASAPIGGPPLGTSVLPPGFGSGAPNQPGMTQ